MRITHLSFGANLETWILFFHLTDERTGRRGGDVLKITLPRSASEAFTRLQSPYSKKADYITKVAP